MTQLVPYAFQNVGGSEPLARLDDNFNYVSGKWVSVMDAAYGAKGDGVTDDATAINNALSLSPSGSTVILPPGKYRVGSTITVPAGKRLVATGYARATNDPGVVLVADLAVTPVVTLDGGAGSYATALTGVFVSRAAGTVPANSIGVLVQRSNASYLADVNVYRADIAYKYASDAVNSKMERCETATISGTHLWLEGFGLMAHSCRFGKDGGADVNCNEYVRIKGGGDTYYFSECHFNLSAGRALRILYFDTYSSPNGIITLSVCHVEMATSGVASTGTAAVERLTFDCCTLDVGGSGNQFFNVPSGLFNRMECIGNHIHGDVTIDGHAHTRFIGNHVTDAMVVNAGSGVVTDNNFAGNYTISGACTGMMAGRNMLLSNTATLTNTATGLVTTFGNYQADATKTAAITQSLNGLLSLLQGQIKFPASQNASSNANTLDDYQESQIYSPADASGAALVLTTPQGIYSKIGGVCIVGFKFTYPVTADATNAAITLPFTCVDVQAGRGGGMIGLTDLASLNSILVTNNAATMQFMKSDGTNLKNSDMSGKTLYGAVIYFQV